MNILRRALSLFLLCCCIACNSPATVTATNGRGSNVNITSSARMGGRGGVVAKSGDLVVAVYDNNEDSFREVNKTARLGFWISALNSIADTVGDTVKSTVAAKEATQVSTINAQAATKQLQITTEAQTAALEAAAP